MKMNHVWKVWIGGFLLLGGLSSCSTSPEVAKPSQTALSESQARAAAVPWPKNAKGYYKIRSEQKVSQEPALVYFSTVWCPYCRAFERKILKDPSVIRGLSGVLKVHVDSEIEPDLAERYSVTGIPYVFILYPNGKISEVDVSSTHPAQFLSDCQSLGLKITKES